MGGIGIWQLLIILVIVILLFGTKRLKGMGSDLGDAIKGFRKAVIAMTTNRQKVLSDLKRAVKPLMRLHSAADILLK